MDGRSDEAHEKAPSGEQQERAKGNFEPTLWQRMRELCAERGDPA